MPKYFPIETGFAIDCERSNLLSINWQVNKLAADFVLPDDELQAIRVQFAGPTIIRVLDEMPLSTEDDPANIEGLVPNNFAYRVEGSAFEAAQSEAWKIAVGPVSLFEFVTGWGCMDVLSPREPTFEAVRIAG